MVSFLRMLMYRLFRPYLANNPFTENAQNNYAQGNRQNVYHGDVYQVKNMHVNSATLNHSLNISEPQMQAIDQLINTVIAMRKLGDEPLAALI